MIVVKLMGGLGNQMFQYAYALSLAKEYGEDILFDTSFFPEKYRLGLYNFQVSEHRDWKNVISEKEQHRVVAAQKKYRLLQKAKRVFLGQEELGERWFTKNSSRGHYFNFDQYYYPFVRCGQENKYIYGYFQTEKYFTSCSDQVKESFQLSIELSNSAKSYLETIKKTSSVALHIRLGDYKTTRNFYLDVCTPEYYKKAMEYILSNTDSPKFFIFTNDANGVRKVIDPPDDAIIVEGTKDYEDFELIRNCNHAVLSNSSFSWWAAYLNPKKGIIVVPTPWFKTLKRESDIYLPGMKKIEV